MKWLALGLTLGCSSPAPRPTAPPAQVASVQTGAIRGSVSGKRSGGPLSGVTVVLHTPGPEELTIISDEHGSYLLHDVPPGHLKMTLYYNEISVETVVDVVAGSSSDLKTVIDEDAVGRVCTLIGCQDGFGVAFARKTDDGVPIDSRTHVFGLVDGKPFDCVAVPDQGSSDKCANAHKLACSGVEVDVGQVVHQEPGASCDIELLTNLNIPGTPRHVRVTIAAAGKPPIDRAFSPSYTHNYPNGASCDSGCSQAGDHIVLP